jgi:hypothetical protein
MDRAACRAVHHRLPTVLCNQIRIARAMPSRTVT